MPLISLLREYVKKNSDKLCKKIKEIHPITKDDFYKYRLELQDKEVDKMTKASYFFAINRTSFSGCTLSGGFSNDSSKKSFYNIINRKNKKF